MLHFYGQIISSAFLDKISRDSTRLYFLWMVMDELLLGSLRHLVENSLRCICVFLTVPKFALGLMGYPPLTSDQSLALH
jgi:hypothetical protein